MAEFEIKCPHCQCPLMAQADWIGMDVECPVCHKNFTVQRPASASMPAELRNSRTFTFVCPSCSTVAELPVSLLGQKYECQMCFEEHIAQATTERQCPVCGQTIKYHAAVCKFCKADLTRLPPRAGNAAKPPQEEKFIFICPECDTVAELPLSAKGQEYTCKACCETTVAQPAEERKCPLCGEKIKIKAAVCKHCKQPVSPLMPAGGNVPPAAGGSMPSQVLTGLKSIGSRLFAGNQSPQMQPVGAPPPRMQPVGAPPPQMQPVYNNLSFGQGYWGITEAGAGFLRNIGLCLFSCGCISAILSPIVSVSPISVRVALSYINLLLSLGILVIFCIWLYQMWKQVPPAEAKTTPGKAVGFLFIPFYDIYWVIAMPGWLSKHYNQFNESKVSLQKWWHIFLGVMVLGFLILIFVAIANRTSYADAQAASEFFGNTNNKAGSGNIAAVIAAQIICSILNSVLYLNWLFRMWKCSQKIPRIG